MKTPLISVSHFGNVLRIFLFLFIEEIFNFFRLPHLWSPSEEKPTDGSGSNIVVLDESKNTLATTIHDKLFSLLA